MPLPITADDIAARLRDFPRDNYLFVGSVFKGVALYVSSVALLHICDDFTSRWTLLGPWFASLMATLITYTTWGRGILITNARCNIGDSIFPSLMGILEAMLFGVLLPEYDSCRHCWFLFFFLHAGVAVFLIINRLRNSVLAEDFDDNTRPVGALMEKWLRRDRLGAGAFAVAALLIWIVLFFVAPKDRAPQIQMWSALAIGIGLIKPVMDAARERREIDKAISALIRAKRNPAL